MAPACGLPAPLPLSSEDPARVAAAGTDCQPGRCAEGARGESLPRGSLARRDGGPRGRTTGHCHRRRSRQGLPVVRVRGCRRLAVSARWQGEARPCGGEAPAPAGASRVAWRGGRSAVAASCPSGCPVRGRGRSPGSHRRGLCVPLCVSASPSVPEGGIVAAGSLRVVVSIRLGCVAARMRGDQTVGGQPTTSRADLLLTCLLSAVCRRGSLTVVGCSKEWVGEGGERRECTGLWVGVLRGSGVFGRAVV